MLTKKAEQLLHAAIAGITCFELGCGVKSTKINEFMSTESETARIIKKMCLWEI